MKYMDPNDGDWINISTDEELLEALEMVKNSKPHMLRMELFLNQQFLPDMIEDDACSGHSRSSSGFRTAQGDGSEHNLDIDDDSDNTSKPISTAGASSVLLGSGAIENLSRNASAAEVRSESSPSRLTLFQDTNIMEQGPAAPAPPIPGPASSSLGHDEALARILDMGFDDIPRIESLLRSCDGDVDAVLEALLAG